MMRTTVLCHTPASASESYTSVNLNNAFGFEPHLSYTLTQYLEDLADEGFEVVSRVGNAYRFSDGSVRILVERRERVDIDALHPLTRAKIRNTSLDAGCSAASCQAV